MGEKTEYRVYAFGIDGHIQSAKTIECSADDEAVRLVEQMVKDRPLELWRGAKCLGRFGPQLT